MLEVPLTIGLIGAALLPILAADRRRRGARDALHDRGRARGRAAQER